MGLAAVLAACGQFAGARASQAPSAPFFTLSQALDLAEASNPGILSAKRRWDAVRHRAVQAATPEKPRLDIERMYAPAGKSLAAGADERSFSITQELPFPTSLYLRHALARQDAGIAEQEYRAKVRDVLSGVRAAYAMYYLAHRSIDISNEHVELMKRFSKVAESKYTAGRASQSDALKAQVELTKMLNMSLVLLQDSEAAQAMLNALLGRDAGELLGTPGEPEPPKAPAPLEELRDSALAQRPELAGARIGAERAARSVSLARSEYLPSLMLQYRRRWDPTRGSTQDGVLGFSVPLWFWRPAAMIAEAKAEKEMSEAELRAMEVMTLADLKTARIRVETAQRLSEIFRTTVLPQAEAALRVAEAGYQAEKTSFLDLLDAERSLLNFRLEYYQTLADYQLRLSELERAVGRRL
ncbi:MAG: TolC family protein [Elusimicrobia bacterium]|nr:TolC family protein [Elusimicrobiota bacterium]